MLIQRFREWARRQPDASAIITDRTAVSFAELDARSDRLAGELQRHGVGPTHVVGTFLPRGVSLTVAVLAIVKTGAAYAPLPAEYPPARRRAVAEAAGIALVVTRATTAREIEDLGLRPLPISSRGPAAAVAAPPDDPERLACVIPTSGSTGPPRGVAVRLGGIERLVIGCDYVDLAPDTVVGQAATASFDAFTFELWGPLANGGSVRILTNPLLTSIGRLLVASAGGRPTVLFLTTALFNRLATTSPASLHDVSCLLFGGETADPAAVAGFLDGGYRGRLVHMYGPTEATTFATWWDVDRRAIEAAGSVPIGRPIAGTTVSLRDREGEEIAGEGLGEIFIGGAGVALGYVGEPELTARRFIPDPHEPGGRLYRTGDLARRRADGLLDFVGRTDAQVKIRGYRVEPLEVESTLLQHPAVRQAAVVVSTSARGERSLIAYVVWSDAALAEDLTGFLASRLPPYACPARVIPLPDLPMTPNGKLDRRALPKPF